MKHFILSVLTVGLILTLLIAGAAKTLGSTMTNAEWEEEVYIVEKGDSLWAIASQYCPSSVDKRHWIDEVQELNDLDDSIIYPGQRLIVLAPIDWEE